MSYAFGHQRDRCLIIGFEWRYRPGPVSYADPGAVMQPGSKTSLDRPDSYDFVCFAFVPLPCTWSHHIRRRRVDQQGQTKGWKSSGHVYAFACCFLIDIDSTMSHPLPLVPLHYGIENRHITAS